MKKLILLSSALTLCFITQAQIKLVSSSIVNTGSSFNMYTDTSSTGMIIQTGGSAEMEWDVSFLQKHESEVITFRNADWDPSLSSLFPGANLILQSGTDKDYTFLNKTSTTLVVMGSAVDTGAGPLELETIGFSFVAFPIGFSDTIREADKLLASETTFLGISPGPGAPMIDSLRAEGWLKSTFIGEGSGKLKFASDSVDKVVMISNEVIIYPRVYALSNGAWTEINKTYAQMVGIPYDSDTSYRHNWWSTLENSGAPCLSYDYETQDDSVSSIEFSDATPMATSINNPEISVKIYPNPTSDILSFEGLNKGQYIANVLDLSGKLVLSKKLENGTLDLTTLSKGNYVVTVATGTSIVKLKNNQRIVF